MVPTRIITWVTARGINIGNADQSHLLKMKATQLNPDNSNHESSNDKRIVSARKQSRKTILLYPEAGLSWKRMHGTLVCYIQRKLIMEGK
jgi:hypothetical protein